LLRQYSPFFVVLRRSPTGELVRVVLPRLEVLRHASPLLSGFALCRALFMQRLVYLCGIRPTIVAAALLTHVKLFLDYFRISLSPESVNSATLYMHKNSNSTVLARQIETIHHQILALMKQVNGYNNGDDYFKV